MGIRQSSDIRIWYWDYINFISYSRMQCSSTSDMHNTLYVFTNKIDRVDLFTSQNQSPKIRIFYHQENHRSQFPKNRFTWSVRLSRGLKKSYLLIVFCDEFVIFSRSEHIKTNHFDITLRLICLDTASLHREFSELSNSKNNIPANLFYMSQKIEFSRMQSILTILAHCR